MCLLKICRQNWAHSLHLSTGRGPSQMFKPNQLFVQITRPFQMAVHTGSVQTWARVWPVSSCLCR